MAYNLSRAVGVLAGGKLGKAALAFAVVQVQAPAGERAALGDDHTAAAALGDDHLGGDGVRLVLQVDDRVLT